MSENYLDDEPILIKYWDEDGNEVSFEELYYDEDYDKEKNLVQNYNKSKITK